MELSMEHLPKLVRVSGPVRASSSGLWYWESLMRMEAMSSVFSATSLVSSAATGT